MRYLPNALAPSAMLWSIMPVLAGESSYAGQEKRAIKALSEQEIEDYMNGRGMGTAKAADLNQYPGPRHVLDWAAVPGLSQGQTSQAQKNHDAKALAASRVGNALAQKEAEPESPYANQKATAENTEKLVWELATLQVDYRLLHLNAHLAMRQILIKDQIAMFDQIRGYSGTKSGHSGHKRH